MMRYFLVITGVIVSGVIGGVLGWTAGMIMDRYRWLGLGPEEFWHTDPEQVWAWGFLVGGAAGMAFASVVAAWLIRRPGRMRSSTAMLVAFGCVAVSYAQPPAEKPAIIEF